MFQLYLQLMKLRIKHSYLYRKKYQMNLEESKQINCSANESIHLDVMKMMK